MHGSHRRTFLQDVGGRVSPREQNGDAPGHQLLGVAVGERPDHQTVPLPIPLPVRVDHGVKVQEKPKTHCNGAQNIHPGHVSRGRPFLVIGRLQYVVKPGKL